MATILSGKLVAKKKESTDTVPPYFVLLFSRSVIFTQVCGSDGYTYDSVCELRRKACMSMKNIQVAMNNSCEQRMYSIRTCSIVFKFSTVLK